MDLRDQKSIRWSVSHLFPFEFHQFYKHNHCDHGILDVWRLTFDHNLLEIWIQERIVMDRHHFHEFSDFFLMLCISLKCSRRHTMRLAHTHAFHWYFWFRMNDHLQTFFWRLYILNSCFCMFHLFAMNA